MQSPGAGLRVEGGVGGETQEHRLDLIIDVAAARAILTAQHLAAYIGA